MKIRKCFLVVFNKEKTYHGYGEDKLEMLCKLWGVFFVLLTSRAREKGKKTTAKFVPDKE